MPAKQCVDCEREYHGSLAGAIASHAGNKVGYFGSVCDCGGKLSESYEYHGVLGAIYRVYASYEIKWRKSLSEKEHRKIFGGPKDAVISQFWYHELFTAKNMKEAEKKFLKLYRRMARQAVGRARLFRGSCGYYSDGVYSANYGLQTAGAHDEVEAYLESKRQHLGVKKLF